MHGPDVPSHRRRLSRVDVGVVESRGVARGLAGVGLVVGTVAGGHDRGELVAVRCGAGKRGSLGEHLTPGDTLSLSLGIQLHVVVIAHVVLVELLLRVREPELDVVLGGAPDRLLDDVDRFKLSFALLPK